MPRLQVYLPDELYDALKARSLPASELLQDAVRAELRRRNLEEKTDAYVADLIAEVGEPTAKELAKAATIASRLRSETSARRTG